MNEWIYWCLFMWRARWSDLEKHRSQWLHLNGLDPVCFLKCLVNSSDLANLHSHPSHEHLYGFSPVIFHFNFIRIWFHFALDFIRIRFHFSVDLIQFYSYWDCIEGFEHFDLMKNRRKEESELAKNWESLCKKGTK